MEKTYKYGKFEIVVIETEDRLPNEFWAQVNIPEEVGWGSEYEFTLEDALVYLIKRVWEDQESGGLTVAVELAIALVSLGLMPANFQINDTTAVIEGTWYFGYSDSYEGSVGIEKVNSVSYIPIDNLEFGDEVHPQQRFAATKADTATRGDEVEVVYTHTVVELLRSVARQLLWRLQTTAVETILAPQRTPMERRQGGHPHPVDTQPVPVDAYERYRLHQYCTLSITPSTSVFVAPSGPISIIGVEPPSISTSPIRSLAEGSSSMAFSAPLSGTFTGTRFCK